MNKPDVSKQTNLFPLIVLLFLLAFQGAAVAAETPAHERKLFLKAEKALYANDTRTFSSLLTELAHYPLAPYLEYYALRKNLYKATATEIRDFLTRYADTPLESLLRRAWLTQLSKKQRWHDYVTFYKPQSSTTLQCHYAYSLLQTGHSEEAWALVPPLWLKGESQPKACDPVFSRWRASGRQTPALVWQRFALAMDENETRLARYLRGLLPTRDHKFANEWLNVHGNPKLLRRKSSISETNPYRTDIIVDGLARMSRKYPSDVYSTWQQFTTEPFDTLQLRAIAGTLQSAALRASNSDVLDYLDLVEPCGIHLDHHEKRIRAALIKQDWEKVLDWIEAMPIEAQEDEQWRYWKGRSLGELGHTEASEAVLKEVAKERSFYGFLAADITDQPYNLTNRALPLAEWEIEKVAGLPSIRRASELHALERYSEARREWRYATKNMSRREKQIASKLAQQWGWHDRAVFTLAETEYWDDLDLRFPLEHEHLVNSHATRQQLEPAWIYAVIRQESVFMHDVRSPVGATGLMQLMPATAKSVARKNKMHTPGVAQLKQPDINITLGASYLREVYDELGNKQVLATAAYNAGPHRVQRWLPDGEIAADIWIETVPFRETRGYLRRVMAYTVIYEQRLGITPERISKRMGAIYPLKKQ